jgi:hypothetical protein
LVFPPKRSQDTKELIIPHSLLLGSLNGVSTLDSAKYLVVVVTLAGYIERLSALITINGYFGPPIETFILHFTVFLGSVNLF